MPVCCCLQNQSISQNWALLQSRLDALGCNYDGEPSATRTLKPLDKLLFPRPSAGYELHKLDSMRNRVEASPVNHVDVDDCTTNSCIGSSPAGAQRSCRPARTSSHTSLLATVLQQAQCNGDSLFQPVASSAMLTIPGKDFVAIADIIRVSWTTQPSSNSSIASDKDDIEVSELANQAN